VRGKEVSKEKTNAKCWTDEGRRGQHWDVNREVERQGNGRHASMLVNNLLLDHISEREREW
jgi:hypothetical protein